MFFIYFNQTRSMSLALKIKFAKKNKPVDSFLKWCDQSIKDHQFDLVQGLRFCVFVV